MKHWVIRISLAVVVVGVLVLAGSCNPFNPLAAAGYGELFIYWVEGVSPEIIMKAELATAKISTVLSDPGVIGDILLDKKNERIYWSVESAPPGVYSADLNGDDKKTIAAATAEAMSINPNAGKLYYGGSTGIWQYSLEGGSPLQIYAGTVADIAVDHLHEKIYWSSGSVIYSDAISSSLSPTNSVVTGTTIDSFVLDVYAGKLYWAETGAGFEVREKDLGSGSDRQLFAGTAANALDFDPHDKMLYWSEYGVEGEIHRFNVETGVDASVIQGIPNSPDPIFLDRWP